MQLSHMQKKSLYEEGFVVVPQVIPEFAVHSALKAINQSLGEGEGGRKTNYCLELQEAPVITDLFNKTPAAAIVESLLGEGMMEPVTSAQIALRFPSREEKPSMYRGHLDGLLELEKGNVLSFTALVGVLLSDQTNRDAGNLTVWPGSHHLYEQYFRKHGANALLTEECFRTRYSASDLELPNPVQVTGKAGDIIIAHYQLLHAAGINISHNIRYNCFFRVHHTALKLDWKAPLTNVCLHLPALRAFQEQNQTESA